MCLSRLDARYENLPSYINRVGWKLFHEKDGWIEGQFYSLFSPYPINKWIIHPVRDMYPLFCEGEYSKYVSGFHIYLQKPTNYRENRLTLYEVKFRNMTCTGDQFRVNPSGGIGYIPCVVARDMLILPRKDDTNSHPTGEF